MESLNPSSINSLHPQRLLRPLPSWLVSSEPWLHPEHSAPPGPSVLPVPLSIGSPASLRPSALKLVMSADALHSRSPIPCRPLPSPSVPHPHPAPRAASAIPVTDPSFRAPRPLNAGMLWGPVSDPFFLCTSSQGDVSSACSASISPYPTFTSPAQTSPEPHTACLHLSEGPPALSLLTHLWLCPC